MANRILLQTLLRFSDDIKSGAAKVQDVVTDYFNQTAKSVTDEERGIILKEFQDNAPSNVVEDVFYKPKNDPMKNTPFTDTVRAENPDVEIRGDETFGELMEKMRTADQKDMAKGKGLGSLYPKSETDVDDIFDLKNDKRMEVAAFMRAMRAAGIKNEDVMNTAKITDVAEGKRAATSLARAADMGADTKIKQEILSELDDDIANYGPDWWRGMGYNEGPMGRESVGNLLENLTTTVNNGIYDDLIERGVPEEKVDEVFTYIVRIIDNVKYDPKA